jgi:hypothetical protein
LRGEITGRRKRQRSAYCPLARRNCDPPTEDGPHRGQCCLHPLWHAPPGQRCLLPQMRPTNLSWGPRIRHRFKACWRSGLAQWLAIAGTAGDFQPGQVSLKN